MQLSSALKTECNLFADLEGVTMDYFSSLLVTGLVMGIIYAVMALGLTLIFSILNVINFAHGEFYMLGGYASYLILQQVTGIHPVFIIPIAGLLAAAIGVVFESFSCVQCTRTRLNVPPSMRCW